MEDKPYLPRTRTCYHPQNIRSFAPNGTSTKLANPATNRIVANNIACQEFDYTESLADEGENILPETSDDLDSID
ncbi:hypothetical protein [uncultured Clostridium sp.]|uniref:hypothetical protein n=1 Tax=uncultured Clostridium sp. TaxID=59620 RepID=UPI0025F9D201|nr:hypothetical protein [uncultured Clostridium sp.]